tara:strand:+ start:1157 stop:1516 length:360 start_codon:yes stop_codon:yes gene_type:complete
MPSRYDSRPPPFRNDDPRWMEYFRKRRGRTISSNTRGLTHWPSPEISYPSKEVLSRIDTIIHVWKQGDSFYKLSYQYYGDAKTWWIIPWFNKRPLLSDYAFGDSIKVPLNLPDIYGYFL